MNFIKDHIALFIIIFMILIACSFIPFKKEISLDDFHYVEYQNVFSYKYLAYNQDDVCLKNAYDEAKGDEEKYMNLVLDCKSIDTGQTVEVFYIANDQCNLKYDPIEGVVSDNCQAMYIHEGELYKSLSITPNSNGTYSPQYSEKIALETNDSDIFSSFDKFYADCYAFGLICNSNNAYSKTILSAKKDFMVRKYDTVCDKMSDREKVDPTFCIYKDDTYSEVPISDILKI